MDQEPQDQHSGAGEIDLNKILLPKKEGRTVDSAQRIDAGTLLAQEQNATLLKPTPEPVQQVVISPAPKQPEATSPLQTFQGDISSVVHTGEVSVVSIAAAEANRRGSQPLETNAERNERDTSHALRTGMFLLLGVVLLAAAGGVVWYAFFNTAPTQQQVIGAEPFITIDSASSVTIASGATANAAMDTLVQAKNSIALSLGLVAQLYVAQAGTSTGQTPTYTNAQSFFSLLAPSMPETLLRDIQPVYLLGVHSYGVNQPFLILKVDSYEQGYAGMLAWENTMQKDLSPLFTYVPPVKIQPAPVIQIPITTTTGTSTSSTTPIIPSQLPTSGFIDAIVANHDARVLEDQYGSVDFLWTFLDRQTLVITTNADTLKEVITRLTRAPVTALPSTK